MLEIWSKSNFVWEFWTKSELKSCQNDQNTQKLCVKVPKIGQFKLVFYAEMRFVPSNLRFYGLTQILGLLFRSSLATLNWNQPKKWPMLDLWSEFGPNLGLRPWGLVSAAFLSFWGSSGGGSWSVVGSPMAKIYGPNTAIHLEKCAPQPTTSRSTQINVRKKLWSDVFCCRLEIGVPKRLGSTEKLLKTDFESSKALGPTKNTTTR